MRCWFNVQKGRVFRIGIFCLLGIVTSSSAVIMSITFLRGPKGERVVLIGESHVFHKGAVLPGQEVIWSIEERDRTFLEKCIEDLQSYQGKAVFELEASSDYAKFLVARTLEVCPCSDFGCGLTLFHRALIEQCSGNSMYHFIDERNTERLSCICDFTPLIRNEVGKESFESCVRSCEFQAFERMRRRCGFVTRLDDVQHELRRCLSYAREEGISLDSRALQILHSQIDLLGYEYNLFAGDSVFEVMRKIMKKSGYKANDLRLWIDSMSSLVRLWGDVYLSRGIQRDLEKKSVILALMGNAHVKAVQRDLEVCGFRCVEVQGCFAENGPILSPFTQGNLADLLEKIRSFTGEIPNQPHAALPVQLASRQPLQTCAH